jgi:hypothetical protein
MVTKQLWETYTIEQQYFLYDVLRINFMNNELKCDWATVFVEQHRIGLHCPEFYLPLAIEWIVNKYPNTNKHIEWYDNQ